MSSGQSRSGGIGAGDRHSRAERRVGRYWLRIGRREVRLDAGETLVGRDEACQIVVDEPLVSRRHARITLEAPSLSIEDLGSANGTLVNRARIHGRTPLQPGDRIYLGSREIEVVRYGGTTRSEDVTADDGEDRETPSSGVSVVGRVALSQRSDVLGVATERGGQKATLELDALESAGRLADRMFALGRAEAGRQILSGPLEGVLLATRTGRLLDPRLVDAAGRFAVRLASEVLDGQWVNLAIEVHLLADRPLRAATIQQLMALRVKAPVGDDALIARYYEHLRSRLAAMDPTDRVLCEQIANLVPRLNEGP